MQKTPVSFAPGEPLPAAKINTLVGSTEQVGVASRHEHSPEGLHLSPRFEFAAMVLVRSGNQLVVPFSDRMSLLGEIPPGWVEIVLDASSAPLISLRDCGVIAYNQAGQFIPYQGPYLDISPLTPHIALMPPAGTSQIFVSAFGRRQSP